MNIEWNDEIRKLLEQSRNGNPPTNGEPKPIDKDKSDEDPNKDI